MMYRTSLLITGSLLLLLSFTPLTSQAQGWSQEAEVITTINYDDPLHVLLDSLYWTLDRNQDTHVQRSPQDSTSRPYQVLQEDLYQEGLALPSASHALIRYRFDLPKGGDNVVETIQDIHFILRVDETQEDISILYVKLEEPLIREFINTQGIPSEMNLKSLRSYRDLLTFPVLTANSKTTMVEMGGEAMRGSEGSEKRQSLIRHFRKRGYVLDSVPYTLPTSTMDKTSASR